MIQILELFSSTFSSGKVSCLGTIVSSIQADCSTDCVKNKVRPTSASVCCLSTPSPVNHAINVTAKILMAMLETPMIWAMNTLAMSNLPMTICESAP